MLLNDTSMEDAVNQHKLYYLGTVTERIILFLGSTCADRICS